MKQSDRRLRNLLLILVAAAVIAGAAIYLVYYAPAARRGRALQIDDLLAETDYEISLGYYGKALDTLDNALSKARGQYNSLRILKRVYKISYDSKDFSTLHRFAKRAAESIPGSEELRQIYLYASIRSSADDSRRAIDRHKKTKDLSYLLAEAYLTGLLDVPPDTVHDPELTKIMSLVTHTVAEDPYQLQVVGTDLNEPGIHLDAALLWMAAGDTENAFSVVNSHIDDPLFREPGIFISYDAGRERTALSMLQEMREHGGIADRMDLEVMEADLRLILGDAAGASRLYRQVITAHPAYSWTAYLNLASIAEREGDTQSAFDLRERAYGRFPGVGPVVRAHANNLAVIGDRSGAADSLRNYLDDHADDYQAQLYLLDLENTASSPVLYQAALWQLYNLHPESRMLCEHLFLYLLEFNDLSGAESALRHYQLATGRSQEPWLLDFKAVLSALRGQEAEAERLLQDRLAREDNWQARFNLALLLGKDNNHAQAIEHLIRAEQLLPEERNSYYRSRIRSRIGEQYLLLGDEAAARRECGYAVELDASNFHAHRILRILEGE